MQSLFHSSQQETIDKGKHLFFTTQKILLQLSAKRITIMTA